MQRPPAPETPPGPGPALRPGPARSSTPPTLRPVASAVAQRGLEDLAGRALGQLGHEPDLPRVLVRRESLPGVGDDLLGGGRRARLEGDYGHDFLAEPFVRLAHHGRLTDRRMGVQDLLDLPRVDVVA